MSYASTSKWLKREHPLHIDRLKNVKLCSRQVQTISWMPENLDADKKNNNNNTNQNKI